MNQYGVKLLAQWVTAFALALHVFTPSAIASGRSDIPEIPRLICNFNGQLTAEAQSSVSELTALLESLQAEPANPQLDHEHCELCITVQSFAIPIASFSLIARFAFWTAPFVEQPNPVYARVMCDSFAARAPPSFL